jgi:glycoprotein 6-alpha-L-fucosyltransferase
MQALNVDAANRYRSLDDIYYFGGQNGHNRRAVITHKAQSSSGSDKQISFMPGELIGIAGNHWNGFSMGTIARTGDKGLFPTYKTEDVISVVDFPNYPQVPVGDPSNSKQVVLKN